jgi:hypothetical protein
MTRSKHWLIYPALLICGGLPATVCGSEASSATNAAATKERASADKSASKSMEGFHCSSGRPGWKRAKAITPNLVPPCNTGSSGMCEQPAFEYVSGTGWCRPLL